MGICVAMVCVFVCVHAHMWPECNNSKKKGGQELEREWEQEGCVAGIGEKKKGDAFIITSKKCF